MYSPIYIDLVKDFFFIDKLEEKDPVDLYTLAEDIEVKPIILSPRFFIKIYPPTNLSSSTLEIPIHKSSNSVLRNKVVLFLPPSLSLDVNHSYKMELWYWIPIINNTGPIKKEKVLEQWWNIPCLDCFFPNSFYNYHYNNSFVYYYFNNSIYNNYSRYNYPFRNKNRNLLSTSLSLPIERQTLSLRPEGNYMATDLVKDPLVAFLLKTDNIVSYTEQEEIIQYSFNEEVSQWRFDKEWKGVLIEHIVPSSSTLSDSSYRFNIHTPFSLEDILLTPSFDNLNYYI